MLPITAQLRTLQAVEVAYKELQRARHALSCALTELPEGIREQTVEQITDEIKRWVKAGLTIDPAAEPAPHRGPTEAVLEYLATRKGGATAEEIIQALAGRIYTRAVDESRLIRSVLAVMLRAKHPRITKDGPLFRLAKR